MTLTVLSTAAALTFTALGQKQPISLVDSAEKSTALADGSGLAGIRIRFASGASATLTNRIVIGVDAPVALAFLRDQPGFISSRPLPFHEAVVTATFTRPLAALAAANALVGQEGVRYAHPDFKLEVEPRSAHATSPVDEPLYAAQWHLPRVGVDTAWTVTRGSPDLVIAVLDLGFEQDHPDLRDAWLVNPGEIPGNRLDDDGNGLKDDVRGWNFATNGSNLIYGAAPGHGTATAGIVGARANGAGVVGLCPDCRVLPVVLDDYPSNAAAAFGYVQSFGAAVVSNSWGYKIGTPATDVVVEAIERLAREGRNGKGTTIVFAMSNAAVDNCRWPEPDISALDLVVAVSSVDQDERKVPESGYGACLDLVAPSSPSQDRGVVTVDRPGIKGYNTGARSSDLEDLDYTNTFYGTSAAAPQVAGAFALLYAARPGLTRAEAYTLMVAHAEKVEVGTAAYDANGFSRTHGYGRIDLSFLVE